VYKLIPIALFISFLGIGCSVFRKGTIPEEYRIENTQDSVVLRKVRGNNISREGYFIKRADIEVITEEQKDNIVGTVRSNKTGEYLISLKSKAGIEAARVFLGRDTVIINDRINKILYAGSAGYIEKKFFISPLLFPLIFGDFVSMEVSGRNDSVCVDGKLNYGYYGINGGVSYVIDCYINKTVRVVVESARNKERIILLYSDFKKIGELAFPGKIEVSGLPDQMVVKIEINSIEVPWNGEMIFIPGNKYEIVNLK
jgi:hypothetical protein